MINSIDTVHFEKATLSHKELIFAWLDEPHVREFWDNSQEHRDDILSFLHVSNYKGIFTYWIGSIESEPYCLLMTSTVNPEDDLPEVWRDHLSKTGKTFSIDFAIGNKEFLGKKLAAPTLQAFTRFIQENVDKAVDLFMIDPAETNPRAKHVYAQAGFETVAEFVRDDGFFKDIKHFLMVKRLRMSSVNSTKTASHFSWGKGCEGWWLKQGGKFTVISEIMPPSTSEVRHFHKHTEQFFYVLEGILTIEVDGQEYKLKQHNGMVIPPMTPHRVFNSSDQVVKFLVISCPDSHEDRINVE